MINQGPNPKFLWGRLIWYQFWHQNYFICTFKKTDISENSLRLADLTYRHMSIVWPVRLLKSSEVRKETALFWPNHFFLISFIVCLTLKNNTSGLKLWGILKLSSPFSVFRKFWKTEFWKFRKIWIWHQNVDLSSVSMPHHYRNSLHSDETIA